MCDFSFVVGEAVDFFAEMMCVWSVPEGESTKPLIVTLQANAPKPKRASVCSALSAQQPVSANGTAHR
jgi:hypothetical protein